MSDERTPDQIEADELLVAALENHAKAYGHVDEGWAIGDWIVSMEIMPFAPELAGRQRYARVTPYPTIPLHRLQGLLTVAENDLYAPDEEE